MCFFSLCKTMKTRRAVVLHVSLWFRGPLGILDHCYVSPPVIVDRLSVVMSKLSNRPSQVGDGDLHCCPSQQITIVILLECNPHRSSNFSLQEVRPSPTEPLTSCRTIHDVADSLMAVVDKISSSVLPEYGCPATSALFYFTAMLLLSVPHSLHVLKAGFQVKRTPCLKSWPAIAADPIIEHRGNLQCF